MPFVKFVGDQCTIVASLTRLPAAYEEDVANRELGCSRLVCMPRWLLVETVALSLAANLPDSCSDSDNLKLNLEMLSVEHYVWMGCPVQSGRPAGKAHFFTGYKSPACHYASSSACNR